MRRILAVLLLLVVASPDLANAQTYEPLELVRPKAAGTAGSGLSTNNRIYRAYQGLTYTIHADARGGKWPYTYSLSNAPAGMTIEAGPCTTIGTSCTAGEITWVNPTATATNIGLNITDSLGTLVTSTWSVTVSTTIGTDGFCFLDFVNGNNTTGNGSLVNPYKTILKVRDGSCGARSAIYFRAGTYTVTDLGAYEAVGGTQCGPRQVTFSQVGGSPLPAIWIGYPGETATIDFGSDGGVDVPCFHFVGEDIWIDHLGITNIGSIGFDYERRNNYGAVTRWLTATNLRDGENGANSAFIRWPSQFSGPTASIHDTVQLSTFTSVAGDGAGLDDGCALKVYSVWEGIFETSAYSTSSIHEAMIALKGEVEDYTVRANTGAADVTTFIGGNMAANGTTLLHNTRGEVLHNLCLGSGTSSGEGCLTIDSGTHSVKATRVYRNTFIGGVRPLHTATADGLYTFNDNVILNAGGSGGSCPARLSCEGVSDYTRIVVDADNVQGANDGTIANATTGALVGASQTLYLGVAGYELGAVSLRRLVPMFRVAEVRP